MEQEKQRCVVPISHMEITPCCAWHDTRPGMTWEGTVWDGVFTRMFLHTKVVFCLQKCLGLPIAHRVLFSHINAERCRMLLLSVLVLWEGASFILQAQRPLGLSKLSIAPSG